MNLYSLLLDGFDEVSTDHQSNEHTKEKGYIGLENIRVKRVGADCDLDAGNQFSAPRSYTKSAPMNFILKLGIQSTNSSSVGQSW